MKNHWEWNRSLSRRSKANLMTFYPSKKYAAILKLMKQIDTSGNYKLPIDPKTNVAWDNFDDVPALILVDWYNQYSGSTQIKKFSDRAIAVRRCTELKQAMDAMKIHARANGKKVKTTMAKKANGKKKAAGKKSAGKRGRGVAFAGHILRKLVDENPRRKGTHGWTTWNKIKNGMTYEQLIKAGGRYRDIRHDINLKRLKLEAPKKGTTAPVAEPAAA